MKSHYNSIKRDIALQRHHYAILRAAMDVFSEHGYHGATLEDIASRAGLSKGAIYCHFKDKQDLFMSVIYWGEYQLQHQLQQSRKRYTDARDIIEKGLWMYFRFFEKRVEFFRILVQEKNNFDRSIRSKHVQIINNSLREIEAVIRDGIQDGVLRNVDPQACAVMITGMANGLLFNWIHAGTGTRLNDSFHHALDFIKHGMYKRLADSDAGR